MFCCYEHAIENPYIMPELTLVTPSIMFSAISLVMIAYTNRFLTYTQVIRNLAADHESKPSEKQLRQIANLRKRLVMIRWMQILGITSLFLCVISTFLIYIGMQTAAAWIFGIALLSMIISLAISIAEIHISVKALDIQLDNIVQKKR